MDLLKRGKIIKVKNLDKILNHKKFLDILRFEKNDKSRQMIGSEKQVFARIYCFEKSELVNGINYIHKNLKILGKNNNNLILDKFIIS